jgi:hypothetical protein
MYSNGRPLEEEEEEVLTEVSRNPRNIWKNHMIFM